jgi:hypothetical protein
LSHIVSYTGKSYIHTYIHTWIVRLRSSKPKFFLTGIWV